MLCSVFVKLKNADYYIKFLISVKKLNKSKTYGYRAYTYNGSIQEHSKHITAI